MPHSSTAAAEVQRYLRSIEFPCSKEDLIATAIHVGAPASLLHRLHAIEQTRFESPREVSAEIARSDGGVR